MRSLCTGTGGESTDLFGIIVRIILQGGLDRGLRGREVTVAQHSGLLAAEVVSDRHDSDKIW